MISWNIKSKIEKSHGKRLSGFDPSRGHVPLAVATLFVLLDEENLFIVCVASNNQPSRNVIHIVVQADITALWRIHSNNKYCCKLLVTWKPQALKPWEIVRKRNRFPYHPPHPNSHGLRVPNSRIILFCKIFKFQYLYTFSGII